MKINHALLAAAASTLFVGSAYALVLAPGESGTASGVGISAPGTTLDSYSSIFYETFTDAVSQDDYLSSVRQTSTGGLIFSYQLTPYFDDFWVEQPFILNLRGFQGVMTDIRVLTGSGLEASTFAAARSADGTTLTINGPYPVGNAYVDLFLVEVETNANTFAMNPGGFQTTHWWFASLPPGAPGPTQGLTTRVLPGFAPNAAPIPEPLSLAILSLGAPLLLLRSPRRHT